ncbi:MAG: 3-isopropylmalate dehydrogenase [Thermaerobacter sp.]|nr:3-isopropylmalate dehydrogenase [Thermaerobacter sp.]
MSRQWKIAVLPGDGIGPEVTDQALRVLDAVRRRFDLVFEMAEAVVGGAALDREGTPLPEATLLLCRESDAVLFGAVGGPRWDHLEGELRPEAGLLGLRKGLGLYANLRPAKLFPALAAQCPLRPEISGGDFDLLFVRELTGGIYFGQPRGISGEAGARVGVNTEVYSEAEVERVARRAFQLAGKRRRKLASVDKANVLESSRLWRDTVTRLAGEYPEVELEHIYVDNAAMQLIRRPRDLDVVVTTNLFGDILSDEAAALTGSIGLLPSASLGDGPQGFYEPIHGSAPDLAGQGKANPLAAILSLAMLLRHSLDLPEAAAAVERAVEQVLTAGYRTPDLGQGRPVSTQGMGALVVEALAADR